MEQPGRHIEFEEPSKVKEAFDRFCNSQVNGSIALMVCALLAFSWANSPWAPGYFELIHTEVAVSWGEARFVLPLQHWVNDALMVVFFFVVGLEIKREFAVGHLSSAKHAVLPVAAAAGGMIVPATLYLALNAAGDGARGWGVPMATDIAFSLGVLTIFGRRVPIGLKVFLTSLAIADDLGAVMVIALFYTEKIRWSALAVVAVFLLLGLGARSLRLRRIGLYVILVAGLWTAVFVSGVHATVAGILAALIVPVRSRAEPHVAIGRIRTRLKELEGEKLSRVSMLFDKHQLHDIDDIYDTVVGIRPVGITLEHYFHPLLIFCVLPLFAFFNAGVVIDERIFHMPSANVTLGILFGLFFGKQAGIFLASWLVIRSGRAVLPEGVTWAQLYGTGILAGIGFTMSLLVTELAFSDATLVNEAKVGILAASLAAGVTGSLVLQRALPKNLEGSASNPPSLQ